MPPQSKISSNRFRKPGGIFDSDKLRSQIAELESRSANPNLWNDREEAERVMTDLKRTRSRLEPWESLVQMGNDLQGLYDLAMEEGDESLEKEIRTSLEEGRRTFDKLEVMELLSDEFDSAAAFLTIHSGAGGTEACDWVSMLLRMYMRWVESRNFTTTILDLQEAEGGIKSVTVQVDGEFAHGHLKSETGVHRLVRISPFDSSGRRHTSFASVYVSPVIDDTIVVDVKPEDIRVDTYRASGAGGHHVNKTDSAVRITHLVTNIVVQCQNERSQHKNRALAMKVLKSRLYEYYREEQKAEQAKNAAEKKDISWGNQIRSYVFQPYTMVKDHRTKKETGNVQGVMDGDLDQFMEAYLHFVWSSGV
ncbi:MAG: peptide chain release factor 2 [Spirochaetales bacterium]|nr:MAG: peptide chain release factor 2 [Spirochaetales bacterium]